MEPDDLEARVSAGAADRDVGEIRAEIRDFRRATAASFNAMREDFGNLRREFADQRTAYDRGFAEMRAKLDAAAAGQQQIVGLIQTVIDTQGGGR